VQKIVIEIVIEISMEQTRLFQCTLLRFMNHGENVGFNFSR